MIRNNHYMSMPLDRQLHNGEPNYKRSRACSTSTHDDRAQIATITNLQSQIIAAGLEDTNAFAEAVEEIERVKAELLQAKKRRAAQRWAPKRKQ